MIKLVLLKHDEGKWNVNNKFTGLTDVDLVNNRINQSKSVEIILQTLLSKTSIQKK